MNNLIIKITQKKQFIKNDSDKTFIFFKYVKFVLIYFN